MKLHDQEHTDLMAMFERTHKGLRFDREPKDIWPMGRIYQNGETNDRFLAYRQGYAYGVAVARSH